MAYVISDDMIYKCANCAYCLENTDTGNEFKEENSICHEFIKFNGISH